MKILIGTPIHECKDYAMERWLENVSKLEYPTDLLMIDNSPSVGYVKKVRKYCKNLRIDNYKIKHFEIDQSLGPNIRISRSQELIRQFVLAQKYDVWFSWECDQIIPTDTLDKLLEIMTLGNFSLVVHNSWARWDSTILNVNMGITLITKECLEKCWFLSCLSGSYDVNDPTVFKKRVLKNGGSYIEVYGIVKPIYHLNQ